MAYRTINPSVSAALAADPATVPAALAAVPGQVPASDVPTDVLPPDHFSKLIAGKWGRFYFFK